LDVRNPDERTKLEAFREYIDSKLGLVCCSRDWVDPVLWSHYAVKHRGVALGFDIAEGYGFPVAYSRERLPFDGSVIVEDFEEVLLPFLLTKFTSWEYEQELRIFVRLADAQREGDLYFESFSPQMRLREVILGPLCSLQLEPVRALVNKHHKDVVTIKSRPAHKFFSIVPDEDTVPVVPKPFS
jgi:hypothetical protein